MALLWKFLLAATIPAGYDLEKLPYPLYASPKIDGVRGGVQNAVVLSRNGRPIANKQIQHMYGHTDYEGLDFEITAGKPYGPDVYNKALRMCNKADADAVRMGCLLNVFGLRRDDMSRYGTFKSAYDFLKEFKSELGVSIVKQTLIKDAAALRAFEEKCLAQGYEGVMLRRADSPAYPQKSGKSNRSTMNDGWLLKLKRFDYGECKLLAVHALEHNTNTDRISSGMRSTKKSGIVVDADKFGSVDVVDIKTKARFSITVPTNELRAWAGWRQEKLWKGKVIRYKFFPTGNVSAPRFPTAEFKELLP